MATGIQRSGKASKGGTRWDVGSNLSKDDSKGFSKGVSSHAKSPTVKDKSRLPAFKKGGKVKKRK